MPSNAQSPVPVDSRASNRRGTLARAWGVALVTAVPAGVLHGFAHGHTPPLEAFALAVVLAAALSAPFVASRNGTPTARRRRTAAAIIASQALFHVFFAIATTPIAADAAGGHHAHGAAMPPLTIDAGLLAASSTLGLDMLAAHALAAVLAIVAVRYGERLLAGILGAGREQLTQLARLANAVNGVLVPVRVPRIRAIAKPPRLLEALRSGLILGRAPPALV